LDGLPNDVVYVCPTCATAYSFSIWFNMLRESQGEDFDLESPGARLMEQFRGQRDYPYLVLDSHQESIETFLMPFWKFQVQPRFSNQDVSKLARYKILEQELYPLVPAFSFHGLVYIGWPGQELDIRDRPTLKKQSLPVTGITRDAFTAFIIAWHLVFRKADNLADISNVTMELDHKETVLVGVPGEQTGDKIRFAFSDKEYPIYFFDDIYSIVRDS